MMAEENRLNRFLMDDDEMEEMIEYGEVESRCELCAHYLGEDELTYGERLCSAYQKGKTIPDRIWDEDNLHEEVQSDQIGDFLFERKEIKVRL
jgi:hypothetical protein